VSLTINIFAARAHPRRPYVTWTVRFQTTTFSPELWWAVQMRTTTTWTLAAIMFTTKLPPITTQASKQLSPLSSCWAFKPPCHSVCPSDVLVHSAQYNIKNVKLSWVVKIKSFHAVTAGAFVNDVKCCIAGLKVGMLGREPNKTLRRLHAPCYLLHNGKR